jgi:HK97 family phage major capsid protein
MSLATAREGIKKLAVEAKSVMDSESLSVAEKAAKIEALEADLKSYSDEVSLHEQANRLLSGGETADDAKEAPKSAVVKSVGQQIVESDAYKTATDTLAKAGRFSTTMELGTKTAGTIAEGTTISGSFLNGNAGTLALPDFLPGIVPIKYAPLAVAALFAQGSTTSPIVSYVKQSAETVGAAAVAEAAAKPQSDATFARVNEQVGKIAAFFKITDEMLQDAAQAQSFLQNMLVAEVQREEDNEALNGSGYPALAGVMGRSGLQTTISVTTGTLANPSLVMDAIYQQVTAIRFNAFVEPDAIVINPTDWQYLRLAKDGNKQYYSGGPFTGAYGNGGYSNVDALWGLRVVITPRIAAGTILVGSYAECGQFFRRMGITVEMTNSNEDDFKNNLILVRAESRSALAVYRPGGFGKVAVTWA